MVFVVVSIVGLLMVISSFGLTAFIGDVAALWIAVVGIFMILGDLCGIVVLRAFIEERW